MLSLVSSVNAPQFEFSWKASLMKVAFLGLGKMGLAMSARLLEAGHRLTVWNRTPQRAQPLVAAGAVRAATPAEAVIDADAVITMLFDDAANEEVLFGADGIVRRTEAGRTAYLLQHHQRGPLRAPGGRARKRGIAIVAAPVFGRPNMAEEGRLWIVAAGQERRRGQARPLLQPLSRGSHR